MTTLDNEHKFSCRYCDRLFKRLEHAQRHERTHTKEAPYRCYCGSAFPRPDLLRRHERSAHKMEAAKRKRGPVPSTARSTGQLPPLGSSSSCSIPRSGLRGPSAYQSSGITQTNLRRLSDSVLANDNFSPPIFTPSSTQADMRRLSNSMSTSEGFSPPTFTPRRPSVQDVVLGADTAQPDVRRLSSSLSANENYASSIEATVPAGHLRGQDIRPHAFQPGEAGVPLDSKVSGFHQQPEELTGANMASCSLELFGLDPFDLFADGVPDFEDNFSSYFLSQDTSFDGNLQTSVGQPNLGIYGNTIPSLPNGIHQDLNQEHNSISRLGSPLPLVREGQVSTYASRSSKSFRAQRFTPCWKVSKDAHEKIGHRLDDLSAILPPGFTLPSRHTISRYLEGCFKGLMQHMPMVHEATFDATRAAPELLLAMIAIGAQFRWEIDMGVKLFHAAKALIDHRGKSRHDMCLNGALLNPTAVSVRPMSGSPISPRDFAFTGSDYHQSYHHPEKMDARVQTMQAIIALMVMGSWGPKELVQDAICLQSLLAMMVREDGLRPDPDDNFAMSTGTSTETAWRAWIRLEGRRRIKNMAFTFINLQSVAFHLSPSIMNTEFDCTMPVSAEEWQASSSQSWYDIHQRSRIQPVPFSEAFNYLFHGSDSPASQFNAITSSLANHTLIYAILQCIFFLRQGHAQSWRTVPSKLRLEDIDDISKALHKWQGLWESNPESNMEPQSPAGPVAFNSTAFLRLAWIRLHSDLGPCRSLASRDPHVIVEAYRNCPDLKRSPDLTPAILHAAHALSVPIRLGIQYVAKTQILTWSVQHCLCNLECAIFLSKWFETVAATVQGEPLTSQEKGLVAMIKSLVQETGSFRDDAFDTTTNDGSWQTQIRHLGTAVASLWAEIFSSNHVFVIVTTIGESLSIYAKLLEDSHTPINDP